MARALLVLAGRAVAVWGAHDQPGFGDPRVRAAVSDPEGNWTPVTGLEAAAANTVLLTPPALEVSPGGDVLVAWVGTRRGSPVYGDPLQVATGTTANPALQAPTMDATYRAGVDVLADVAPDGSATAVTGAPESPALLRRRTLGAAEQPTPCPSRAPARPGPVGGTDQAGGAVRAARQRLRAALARGLRSTVRYATGGPVRAARARASRGARAAPRPQGARRRYPPRPHTRR